jgi:ABC-type sugar transport system ATPase subunit
MSASDGEILVLEDVSKSFGVVRALKGVSFPIRRGEIHAILGENGAGKSTLVKIIKGELLPDSGRLFFEGSEIRVFDPLHANSIGITMVHQELTIFEDLTVAENIYPNNVFRTRLGLIDKQLMLQKAREQLSLFNLSIDPAEKIANLPLADQRIVEILRATALERKLIILDEPTSGLSESDVRILIDLIKRLKAEGITILYISHRIAEVLELSDRVSILKDGNYVKTVDTKEVDSAELIRLMVGRELDLLYSKKKSVNRREEGAYLDVRDVSKSGFVNDVSLTLYRREILGIYGLEGSGVEKLSHVLFGLDEPDTGSISVEGDEVKRHDTDRMIRKGVVYLNNNRKQAGLFFGMSAADNMACPVLERLSLRGILKRQEIQKYTEGFVQRFNIVIPGVKTKPRNLSGGNQQKLMFSICLGAAPACVILNEPTRGIDVGAKAEIHKFILGLPEEDTSVVLFSSEIPELMTLCDRVIVMKNNTIVDELAGEEIEEEKIMTLAAGD